VKLFKPRDLFPCVEDPQKLSYLDLEGCFGDICDLKENTYLKQRNVSMSDEDAKDALQTVLAERWAYDDISDEEASDEDEDDETVVQTDDEPSVTDPVKTQSEHSPSQTELSASFFVSTKENNVIADDTEDEEEGPPTMDLPVPVFESVDDVLPLSQESTSILYKDSQVANEEMVEYYVRLACNGGAITLRSVKGMEEETLL
jgi:hypothetical protein